MKTFLMVALIGGAVVLTYQASAPSPRLTFGDEGRDQWTPAQFSPDGKTILARGYRTDHSDLNSPFDDELKLWDIATGKEMRSYRFSGEKRTQRIHAVGFSPDAKLVLACGQDLPLVMWETNSAKEVLALHGKKIRAPEKGSTIQKFAYSSNESQIITIVNSDLRSWEAKSGKMLKDISLRDWDFGSADVSAIHFSKDGKFFVLIGASQISIWDFSKLQMRSLGVVDQGGQKKIDFWLPQKAATMGYVLSPDGQGILIATTDGKIIELDLATVKEKRSFHLENAKDIHVLAVSPKGDKIMTTGFHGNTIVYSFPECKEIKRMPGYGHVQFSPDGKTALTFTKNGRMMLWDLDK